MQAPGLRNLVIKPFNFIYINLLLKLCYFYLSILTLVTAAVTKFISGLFVAVQDWDHQNPTQIVTEMCGFLTILSGTFLLHKTKDMADSMS